MVLTSQRPSMLKLVHESHLGIVKTKQLARDSLFWPGMGAQIEDLVKQCSICTSHRNRLPSEPMIPHEIPDQPWAKVGIDLFSYKGRKYILAVDYYSKYPDIAILPDETS